MNPLLIFPPLADPTQPYSSLPALAGFLKQHGFAGVSLMDANIDFVRYLLTGKHLRNTYREIESRLGKLSGKNAGPGKTAEYDLLLKAGMKAPFVVQGIDEAVRELQNPRCFQDIARLNNAKRLVNEAMEVISAGAFPTKMGFSNAAVQSFSHPAELGRAIAGSRNPYRYFFLKHTLPQVRKLSPCAIGISITYRSQILPAVTLASLIKKQLPGTPIIFGGNIASYWYEGLETNHELFNWCDFVVAFEGESSLCYLLNAIKHGLSFERVPNLAFATGNKIIKTPIKSEDINCLPAPDYRGLPLDLYLAPESVFLLYTSRGCYWSRCKFCSVSASMRTGYRRRKIELVYDDIIEMKKRHNARYISFSDDCVSSASLKSLSRMLLRNGPEIYWQCEVRFEKTLDYKLLNVMKNAGCRNLIFGLESYSPRVLTLMDKGIHHKDIRKILKSCRDLGIAFNLQFFFGFPGEKDEDAIKTAEFVRAEAHGPATFSFGTFELQKGSIIEKTPRLFNLKIKKGSGPLAIKYDYSPMPTYAGRIRNQLKEDLVRKTLYPHLGLGINAHTLLFLQLAGFSAMAEIHEKTVTRKLPCPDLDIMGLGVKMAANQIMRIYSYPEGAGTESNSPEGRDRIFIYNYKEDRIVEVSPLIAWFLRNFENCLTPSELLGTLVKKVRNGQIKNNDAEILRLKKIVSSSLKELYARGFLEKVMDL